MCVRERKYGSINTKVAKDTLDYRNGSEEMKANSMFEPLFTEWLLNNLPMSSEEAVFSGSYVTGANPETCRRYLKKLASAAGPLREFKDGMGIKTVDFKPDLKNLDDRPLPSKQLGKAASDTKPVRSNKNGVAV